MFFLTDDQIPEGVGFQTFDLTHILWLLAGLILWISACIFYRGLPAKKQKITLTVLGVYIFLQEMVKNLVLIILGQFGWGYLPFHLCGINILLIAFDVFKQSKTVRSFLYYFAIPGAALALGSALTFALYVVLLPRFQSEQFSGFLFCFYFALWSSVILFLICICTGQFSLPTTLTGWGLCLLFATSVTTGAVVLFQQGALRIGGEKASILSALEPITGVVIGIVFMQESAKPAVLIGSALVIASAVLIAAGDLKRAE